MFGWLRPFFVFWLETGGESDSTILMSHTRGSEPQKSRSNFRAIFGAIRPRKFRIEVSCRFCETPIFELKTVTLRQNGCNLV